MALITCPECGREISDKAVACPGCGCPVELHEDDTRTDMEKLVDEIYERNPGEIVKCIKELREATGLDLKTARDLMYIKSKGKSAKELAKERKNEIKQKNKIANENILNSLEKLANIRSGSTSKCPKCRSTQITYGGNRPSIGRALVGGAVAGGAGAAIGGLTGKKGYAVCLNCGKRWKI